MTRFLLFTTMSVLGILTILTHVAQILGFTFSFYAGAVLVLAVVTILAAVFWSPKAQKPIPTTRLVNVILLFMGITCAYLAVASYLEAGDDYLYIPNAVYFLDHPDQPLDFQIHYLYRAGQPYESVTWATAIPHEYIQAALSSFLPIHLLDFYYGIFPMLMGFLLPYALYYLVMQFIDIPLNAVEGVLIGLLVLFILSMSGLNPLRFAFVKLFQGKSVCVALGIPLFAAQSISFLRAAKASRYEWIFLFAITAFTVGTSSTSIIVLFPMWAIMSLAYLSITRDFRKFARREILYTGAMAYTALYAVFLFVHRDLTPDYFSIANAKFPADFQGQLAYFSNPALPVTLIVALVAAPVALLLLRGDKRRLLFVWLAAAIVLFLNPVVSPFLIRYVTTQNIYWRLFYIIPIPFLVAVAAAQIIIRLRERSPNLAHAGFGVLLAMSIGAHLVFGFSLFKQQGNWFWATTTQPSRFSLWDLPKDQVTLAQAIIAATPPGVMYAPEDIGNMISMLSSFYPQIDVNQAQIRFWVEERDNIPNEGENRIRGAIYLDSPTKNRRLSFETILDSYSQAITSIVCNITTSQTSAFQQDMEYYGFHYHATIGDYAIYVANSSSAPS